MLNESGARLIELERNRQKMVEHYSDDHDDQHEDGELAHAANCYFELGNGSYGPNVLDADQSNAEMPDGWPWDEEEWKPKTRLSNLIRAGALYQAEIDRLGRKVQQIADLIGVDLDAAPAESTRVAGEHPEDLCHKCGRPNIVWFAPNPLWNKAVREADQPEILCPVCFVQLAEAAGINPVWEVAPQHYHAGAQPSPSLADAIAKVREMRAEWNTNAEQAYAERDLSAEVRLRTKKDAADEIITALQSLTPSNVVLVLREDAANAAEAAWTHCTHLGQPEDSRYKYASEKAAELVRALPAYGDRKDG